MAGQHRQHSKGKARPRGWHRGRAAGPINDGRLQALDPVFERAEADRAAVAASAAQYRREVRSYQELLAGLTRAAPFALAPLPARLLG